MPKVPYVKSPKMGHGDCNFGRHKTAKSLDVSVPAPSTRALMRWSNAGSPLPLVGLGLWIGSTGNQSQCPTEPLCRMGDRSDWPYERILRHSLQDSGG